MKPSFGNSPASQELDRRAEPFLKAGVVQDGQLSAIKLLSDLSGEQRYETLLLCLLTLAALDRGDVCFDLLQPESPLQIELKNGVTFEALKAFLPTHAFKDRSPFLMSPLIERYGERSHSDERLTAGEGSGPKTLGAPAYHIDRPFVLDGHRLYRQRSYIEERQVCDRLNQLALQTRETGSRLIDATALNRGLDAIFGKASDQPGRKAVLGSFDSALTVITGGPGTGKTWTVRNLITLHYIQRELERLKDPQLPELSVALAAPTGKAAMRMVESLQKDLDRFIAETVPRLLEGLPLKPEGLQFFLEHLQASTLHRLLGVRRFDPGSFVHHAQNPLCLDLLVVDEASMIDLALMRSLLLAVSDRSRLILLGDPNQLASVEAGNVLGDIVSTELDACAVGRQIFRLTVNHRAKDAPKLAEFSALCCNIDAEQDEQAAVEKVVGCLQNEGQIRLLSWPSETCAIPDSILSEIVEQYSSYIDCLCKGPDPDESEEDHLSRAFKLFLRFRVLCAHRDGPFGVSGLNAAILSKLRLRYGIPFNRELIGRPILILQNDPQTGLFNGDIGLCVQHAQSLRVAFQSPSPSRPFMWFSPAQLPDHQTAFAMTIHKSQGSEFDHSFVILPPKKSPILTRELVYTAATRAKTQLTVVSDKNILTEALKQRVLRASGLSERLMICKQQKGSLNK